MNTINREIALDSSSVGRSYYLTEKRGPFIRVTTSQSDYCSSGLQFAMAKSKPDAWEKNKTEALECGSILHGYYAGILLGQNIQIQEDWAIAPINNFRRLVEKYKIEAVEVEVPVVSKCHGLAGRMDAIVQMVVDGKKGKFLIDWKTGDLYKSSYIQLGLYNMMWEEMTGESLDGAFVGQIHRKGKPKERLVEVPELSAQCLAGLHTFERWKFDNRESLMWACAPQELFEARKKTRGKNRIKFGKDNHKAEYVWPWLSVDSTKEMT